MNQLKYLDKVRIIEEGFYFGREGWVIQADHAGNDTWRYKVRLDDVLGDQNRSFEDSLIELIEQPINNVKENKDMSDFIAYGESRPKIPFLPEDTENNVSLITDRGSLDSVLLNWKENFHDIQNLTLKFKQPYYLELLDILFPFGSLRSSDSLEKMVVATTLGHVTLANADFVKEPRTWTDPADGHVYTRPERLEVGVCYLTANKSGVIITGETNEGVFTGDLSGAWNADGTMLGYKSHVNEIVAFYEYFADVQKNSKTEQARTVALAMRQARYPSAEPSSPQAKPRIGDLVTLKGTKDPVMTLASFRNPDTAGGQDTVCLIKKMNPDGLTTGFDSLFVNLDALQLA